ncbi:hypothetical protein SAY87_019813 [Trapa incisa]|uniref:Cytochrome b6-f complex subunit 7 n=1 Tax=Trapa incisa TaxID=236973 RepID=A0AAN7K675_9MYRT|nr:hypothetical protein SAY87_019813 [Trapa incisa]
MVAATAAVISPATVFPATRMAKPRVIRGIAGLSSFGGLKVHNCIASLGTSASTEQSFAKIVSSLRPSPSSKGGALGSTCNAAGEIFRIAAIMNGLVLVGVTVGFVLLRIEASLEEAEAAE